MGNATGFRQQLSMTSFETYELDSELSCTNLNGECQCHAKSHELIDAFFSLSS